MNALTLLFVVPFVTALLSGLFIKARKFVWSVFLAVSVFVSYDLYTLYGHWDLQYSFELGYKVFGENLTLTLGNNPLGWFFAFFAALVTLSIALFSLAFNDEKHHNKISPLWLILIFANFGIFFAQDWLMFFIMWELMGWVSYFVIANGKEVSGSAARFYLSMSLAGASALLLGIILMAAQTKTFDIQASLAGLIGMFPDRAGIGLMLLALFGVTFFIKSAVFPFYMWPQRAYAEASHDFTAFLSTVMSKYGIYGLIMFLVPVLQQADIPALGRINAPAYLIAVLGSITAVLGTLLAIFQTDMKKLFAYSSVANVGYIVTSMSALSVIGIQGALFHSVSHMIYGGAIFLTIAAVIYRTGQRDMHKVGGLVYRMPLTFMTFLLAIIAAASIPPLNGFPSKWLIYHALMTNRMIFVVIALVFASTGAFMYLFRMLASVFLGQLPNEYKDVKEVPLLMAIPMIIMMAAMMAIGVVPGLVMKPLNAVLQSLGYQVAEASWTTLNSPLASSEVNVTHIFGIFAAAVVITGILYLVSGRHHKIPQEDNYTAGEDPLEWGTTPDRFNFSYGFYEPFKEIFNRAMETISFDRWICSFGRNVERLSDSLRGLYLNSQGSVLLLCLGVMLFIIGGWLV
jgi:NADH-quinone oxidoreductase subunit M